MTWSVQDPSLSHATSRAIRNILGYPGAIGADLLMQILGLGAIMLILPVAVWGWRMLTRRTFDREALRLGCWISARSSGRALPAAGRMAVHGRCRRDLAAWLAMRWCGRRPWCLARRVSSTGWCSASFYSRRCAQRSCSPAAGARPRDDEELTSIEDDDAGSSKAYRMGAYACVLSSGKGVYEWQDLLRERVYPTSPPQLADARDEGRILRHFAYADSKHFAINILHHAACLPVRAGRTCTSPATRSAANWRVGIASATASKMRRCRLSAGRATYGSPIHNIGTAMRRGRWLRFVRHSTCPTRFGRHQWFLARQSNDVTARLIRNWRPRGAPSVVPMPWRDARSRCHTNIPR